MRILIVNSHGADPGYGGAERYVRDLAAGMSSRGHEISVLSAFPPRAEVPGLETAVLHGSDWRDDRARRLRNHVGDVVSAPWPRLGRVLKRLAPDLVHTNNLPGIGSGIWEVARRCKVPAVHTLHDYHLLCPRTSLIREDGRPCEPSPLLCGARTGRLSRWSGGVDRVIAGSEHLLAAHAGIFGSDRGRVIRLPLEPLAVGPSESPRTLLTLGYLGALTAAKGVAVLIEALPELTRAGVRVRVAGDGPLRARVEAADLDYAGRLEGEAVEEFLTGCDAGLVPSVWEEPSGPPYTVCEWLAARRPVLTSRRGGLGEAAGRLGGIATFDPNAAALAEAVSAAAGAEAWARLTASVPVVEDGRDLRRWLDEHEAVYDSAVAGGDRRTEPPA